MIFSDLSLSFSLPPLSKEKQRSKQRHLDQFGWYNEGEGGTARRASGTNAKGQR